MLYLIAKIGTRNGGAFNVIQGYRIYDADTCTFKDYERDILEKAIQNGELHVENMVWRNARFAYGPTSLGFYPFTNVESKSKDNWVLTKYFPNYTYYIVNRDGDLKMVSHDTLKAMVDKALICNVPKGVLD